MKEILQDIDRWIEQGESSIALATVVMTWGSSPRQVGAKMAVSAMGDISGSVSGGCVEGAVVQACKQTLESGSPELLHFGVADETAWEVGLACGGSIDIFVEVLTDEWQEFYHRTVNNKWIGKTATIIEGPISLIGRKIFVGRDRKIKGTLDHRLESDVLGILPSIHKPQRLNIQPDVDLFIDVFQSDPVLVMVGGVHVAVELSKFAKGVGYQTVIVDPRRSFGNKSRFPDVDVLIQEWPKDAFQKIALSSDMAVALLTHDPKIDDQALEILVESEVFYIGALGSRNTHAKRVDRLRSKGISDEKISKLFAPIGLNIGSANPEEIALSIMAEIVGVRRGVLSSR